MTKYIIDYENAHWCGGQLFVVVNANSAEEAENKAADWMEETQRELFSDEYNDEFEGLFDDESAYNVNSVEVLDENSEYWKFYKDESQAGFYPELN